MNFQGIKAGDRVTFTTPHGQTRTGRAQLLLCFESHVVVNCGGAHGTPTVVNEQNYVSHAAAVTSRIYVTTYCNHGHYLTSGKPVKHECRVIPPAALAAERAGDYAKAIEIMQGKGVRK